jgi:CRISPR-associated protein Csm3
MDFSSFENQWTITGTIELVSALRIGAGQNAPAYSLSTTPVAQAYNAKEQIYLPILHGSSLKGVIRSGFERLIRTFNINSSCVAVTRDPFPTKLCGSCISCNVFGSMKQGSKICIEDALLSPLDIHAAKQIMLIHEQPHSSLLLSSPDRKRRQGLFRPEEVVVAGTRFTLRIRLDNATEEEVGLLLLTLEEFNQKRLQVGGAVSRGLGFINVKDLNVEKKSLDTGTLISKTMDIPDLSGCAVEWLKKTDGKKDSGRSDFSVYAHAHEKPEAGLQNGHVVAKFSLTTQLPFIMAGMIDESTVTNAGEPYIPGSTIKGFLRHKFSETADDTKTKDFFGDVWNHRSRVLVSDAFIVGAVKSTDEIPKGTKLQMWMVFDNMKKDDIEEILSLVEKEPVVITGKKSAGIDRKAGRIEPTNNLVQFSLIPENISVFRTSTYLAGKIW